MERIVATRSPEAACSVSAVYRAVTLRGDTMGVMPVQYRKKDFEGGNVQDMRGLGKRINFAEEEGRPHHDGSRPVEPRGTEPHADGQRRVYRARRVRVSRFTCGS